MVKTKILPATARVLIFFIVFLSLVIWNLIFRISRVSAISPVPPPGRIPCNAPASNLNFSSDRPYQASPCGDSPKAIWCGNTLQMEVDTPSRTVDGVVGSLSGNPLFTLFAGSGGQTFSFDLSGAQLPIEGNTELTKNSQNATDSIDASTQTNEYVSSYLAGTNNKAENGDSKSTGSDVTNYSGPVQKLIPGAIQDSQRIDTIANATTVVSYTDESGKNVTENATHDQIVVCTQGGKPVDCYQGNNTAAQGKVYHLKDWSSGNLSLLTTFFNWAGTNIWNNKYPPLPWQFKSDLFYQKAYNEWRGESCAIIPIVNKLVCLALPVISNPPEWSNLFRFVPLANTVDHNAKNLITAVPIQGEGGTQIQKLNIQYKIVNEPVLYFPHTQENSDLSNLLNKTYTPKDVTSVPVPDQSVETNDINQCKTVNVRSNPGDYLFAEVKPSEVNVFVFPIAVTRVPCHQVQVSSCGNTSNYLANRALELFGVQPKTSECQTVTKSVCQGTVSIQIQMITKTPYADELWQSTVAGSGSTFRRIYPKVEDNAPVSCIADMPTVTNVTYTQTGGQGVLARPFKVIGPNGNNTTDNPQLFFPHIGSVYEYFLKGIQAALRPQGYSEQPTNGTDCKAITCTGGGKALSLPKASGSCTLGKTSGTLGSMTSIPPSLKQLLEAAAQTYNVPPSLLLSIMYGEGAFNPGNGWTWSESNVKSWLSSCIRMPKCDPGASPSTGPIDFYPSEWNGVKDAIKKIDPTRNPDVCNLADMVFGLAKEMQIAQNGTAGLPNTCFGITLNKGGGGSNSCSWDNSDIETAIKEWESGNTSACLTKENSCATGGGLDAACPAGDSCETVSRRYSQPSHNACLWDVTKNYK